ncbi:MoxR family ATPase [Candidatus Acetothermia bacterium]|jgi:MoxR-like ATPase|nr:MoxR family ATPase [Candidatus Acetothermia bacterium]MCI2432501.1 MoxR family ATPase [Candidatus Acetothermia bacterium]MCI2437293.1 MoxR family ATPase [Candidatus Acetothermia bacterium]
METAIVVAERAKEILDEVERAVIGKRTVLEQILISVLSGGHILIEDLPGLAKTLTAKSFAAVLGLEFKRIQFTPDLLPGDITGTYIYDRNTGRFELRPGPIFANLILADEINRASPKTQAALLEAMQEFQVTLEGQTLVLPQPFIVIATQNPIEFEGTFPLPEAQLDRFLVRVSLGYPSSAEEQEMLRRRRERAHDEPQLQRVMNSAELLAMRRILETIFVHSDLERYMIALVQATRSDGRILIGASPRGSLALLKLSRARAALEGREYVIPDDVKSVVHAALAHRLILQPELWMKKLSEHEILSEILERVPVPKVD